MLAFVSSEPNYQWQARWPSNIYVSSVNVNVPFLS